MNTTLIVVVAVVAIGLFLLVSRRGKAELPPEAETPEPARPKPKPAAALPQPAQGAPASAAAQPAAAVPGSPEPQSTPARESAPEAGVAVDEDLDVAVEVETPAAAAPETSEADRKKDLARLRKGLASTRGGFISRLAKLFGSREEIDTDLLEEIEAVLITADIGVKTTDRILEKLKATMEAGELKDADAVWAALRAQAKDILSTDAPAPALDHRPSLILVAGVNGVGKTTTIGKLASRYEAQGKRVLLAAADTYRAAAVLQLEVWGDRVGCPVVKGNDGADPGSVIFDAVKRAEAEGFDLVIADTAGRLHTKAPLMDELKKVERTVTKALGGRPADEILLVLDSTTGQNAVQQMHMFREALAISGVVLTKLDGTAKGGVVLGIVDEHKLPIRFIGLGERVEDLREFDVDSFVEALFEKPDGETLAA